MKYKEHWRGYGCSLFFAGLYFIVVLVWITVSLI